jgi:tetratricopeptide (TPR) repeat protein
MRRSGHSGPRFSAIVYVTTIAAAITASANAEIRHCNTTLGGQVICGDQIQGITLEQYEERLKKRAEEIRAEEAEKRIQLQKLVDLTERATSAEKDDLRGQIATVQAEKRTLEAESRVVADRLANLQASYDGLEQKLADANAALNAFLPLILKGLEDVAPLIPREAFERAVAMLRRGDVLGVERVFIDIANEVRKRRAQGELIEARALFEAGKLAEERIDLRAAYTHYASAARLLPNNWRYANSAGILARTMGDYASAATFGEAALNFVTAEFGADAPQTATVLNNLSRAYQSLARYAEAEPLYRRAIEIGEKTLGKDDPTVAIRYSNLAGLLQDQGKYDEAEPLYRRAIEIGEKTLGKDDPAVAIRYTNLASLLKHQRKYDEAESLYRRAIEIGEKTLGKDHPSVAIDYSNLADLLQAQGKYEEGKPPYRHEIGEH